MINGLYVATSGLLMQEKRVNTISNNLANVNTAAYKKDVPVFTLYNRTEKENPQDIIKQTQYNQTINSSVKLADIKSDFAQGYLKKTDGKYDFALGNKNAFFAVDTPFGIRYTRSGQFTVNERSELVTPEGYNVISGIDNPEPITIPEEGNIVITEDGYILEDGAESGRIGIAEFEDLSKLQKTGRNLYTAIDTLPVESEKPVVTQGYLEGSNVDPVMEMVRMIEATRGFETYSKIIQTIDGINSKAVNEVGSLS